MPKISPEIPKEKAILLTTIISSFCNVGFIDSDGTLYSSAKLSRIIHAKSNAIVIPQYTSFHSNNCCF